MKGEIHQACLQHIATNQGRSPTVQEGELLRIKSLADIRTLSALHKVAINFLYLTGIVVDIAALDAKTKEHFDLEIKKYVNSCGCAAGKVAFFLGSAVFFTYAAYLTVRGAWAVLVQAAIAGVVLIPTLTILSKVVSLCIARMRFRRSCAKLIPIFGNYSPLCCSMTRV